MSAETPNQGLHPPKTSIHEQYLGPKPSGKQWMYDSDHASGSVRRSTQTNSLLEGYESSTDSSRPSYPRSLTSSMGQIFIEASDTRPSSLANHEIVKPSTPAKELATPSLLLSASRFSRGDEAPSSQDSSSQHLSTDEHVISIPPPVHHTCPDDGLAIEEATVVGATKKAIEAQRLTERYHARCKRNITLQKLAVTAGLVAVNFIFIFASWWWAKYYYAYLPFICLPLVLNCIMIASIGLFKLKNTILPESIIEPSHLESMVMVMPCYNETLDECTRSLDSLVYQTRIEENKKSIMVICDGRVRGPGMEKTTAEYLMDDILVNRHRHETIKHAYKGWDGQDMDIEVTMGSYKGVPFYCIVKEKNKGKRDSLIVIRSFLYKFNIRHTNPGTIFSRRFFQSMVHWLSRDVGVNTVDHLVGMDADTVFDTDCIFQLLKESKYPNTVGVCGYVAVDFSNGNWNLWSLYQNAEYTIAQGLRRLHQSIATKKVSCLPGCCQLLRICEYTCGDRVLIELFGYHPSPSDGILKQIRATASEDRNHVCLMLTTFPHAQTRQALRARAFTDVPHSWSVFLSQRRRWTLGATSNDLLLFTAKHCQWWERIVALSNVLVWALSVFVVASIGCMIVAFMTQPWWIIMAFAGVMVIPILYYIAMAIWLPRTMRERIQFLLGLFMFVIIGPFLNITIMIFAVLNMDSFGWGKTRLVVSDEGRKALSEKLVQENFR